MRVYLFLDTSAVAKRYVTETGSEWVRAQCRKISENMIILSHATLAEAVTAFCRKARQQDLSRCISESDRDRRIKRFCRDVEQQYSLVDVTKEVYIHAGDLCRIHKLRAYDAIQLVCALQANIKIVVPEGVVLTFVSADTDLLGIAEAEGLDIQNPNVY